MATEWPKKYETQYLEKIGIDGRCERFTIFFVKKIFLWTDRVISNWDTCNVSCQKQSDLVLFSVEDL